MKNDALLKLKMKNCWKVILASTFLPFYLSTFLPASTILKDITVKSEVDKDVVSIVVSSKTKYNIFRVSQPSRVVVELIDCEYGSSKKNIAENTQFIKSIRGSQYKKAPIKKSRIVIDLAKKIRYSARATDNEITVEITEKKQEARISKKQEVVANEQEVKKSTETPSVMEEHTSSTSTVVSSVRDVNTDELSEEAGTAMNTSVVKPVVTEAITKKQDTKKEKWREQRVQRIAGSGDLPRDPVTLDFADADIKDVLQILAVKTGMNIIYSDDVSGTISLHLENVPFNEAMKLILQMKGLVLQQVASNVLRVMTPATLTKERADSVQVTQVYRLSYSKAEDLSSKISSVMTAENQKITVQTDERTNSIIVTSTPEGLLAAASLISKLDVRPEQVLIESKIVEITVGDTKDLGIEWNLASGNVGAGDKIGIGGSKTDAADYGATADGQREPEGPLGKGVGVAAPSASSVGGFTFGYFKSDLLLTARLAAAQSKGNAKILSQPRIATLNNLEAKIVVGDQIPYAQTTVTTAGSTQSTAFMTVGIQMTVTPTINADGRITMKIKPEVSYATRITAIGPQISTRNAETTVLVRNGETVVIGGMITDQERKDVSQVPLLGDLPLLGHFFKSQHNDKTKTELLVFVTPSIMKE